MKTLLSILIILVTLLFSVSTVSAMLRDDHFTIKQHPAEAGQTKPVLLLHSLPAEDKADYLINIEHLTQILQSHWNVDITIEDYINANQINLKEYHSFIFIELNRETAAADYFASIARSTEAKTYWVGFGTEAALHVTTPASNLEPISVQNVTYKEVDFDTDEEFVVFSIYPDSLQNLEVLAEFTTTDDSTHPFIVISNGKDILAPFGIPYYYETPTYSLPFIDSFHYLLGHHEKSEKQPALMRLEDVNVHTYRNPHDLLDAYQLLASRNIPFHIAIIAQYVNPTANIVQNSDASKRYLNAIKQMANSGYATLVQHGYTHQVGDEISGIGFEFWDGKNDQPLPYDSTEYAQEKVARAQEAMAELNLPVPNIWETPHYAQSDIADSVFNQRYPVRYDHIRNIGSLPFVVNTRDTVFLPENLGFITNVDVDFEDIEKRLQQLSTFEDPIASGFWHPWREIEELEQYVDLVESYGYQFVAGYDLLKNEADLEFLALGTVWEKIYYDDVLFYFILFSFTIGVGIYARNVFLVTKHLKLIDTYSISLEEVMQIAQEKKKPLPRLGIFIPARNEAFVIANTLNNVSQITYPKDKMRVFVIVDERELDDPVPKTTKEVAQAIAQKLNKKYRAKFIQIVEVPKWFGGVYGKKTKLFGKSTKGRALNYCLQKVDRFKLDMIGVLDADGRLHQNVLAEVAYRRLKDNAMVLQGSVFQVNNFANVSLVGVAAGIELALHHLTELPSRLMKEGALQFLAGTNYFVDTNSIKRVKGWDQNALVEDAELALRLYISEKIVGEWLHTPELEQTPAKFSVYKKQRERWVRGHLEILKQIYYSRLSIKEKLYFFNKILLSQFRFLFDLGLPLVSISFMLFGTYVYLHPIFFYLTAFLLVTSFFVWDTYGFVYRMLAQYIDQNMSLKHKTLTSIKLFIFLPVFIVVQSIPRIEALYNILFHPERNTWYKTERTVELEVK